MVALLFAPGFAVAVFLTLRYATESSMYQVHHYNQNSSNNRDLSWLGFNLRVLQLKDAPCLNGDKILSIFLQIW